MMKARQKVQISFIGLLLLILDEAATFVHNQRHHQLRVTRPNHKMGLYADGVERRRPSSLVMTTNDDGIDRGEALRQGGLAIMGVYVALITSPLNAQAKKVTNLEEARERGEKKMDEIEKAKGPLVILKDGVRYREEFTGNGPTFEKGDLVKIRYQVYKGNGDYMFSTGYGREFQKDIGDTYDFTFGRPNSIPKGAEIGMEGMKVGGKRKILIPPSLGWETSGGLPEPQTFSGRRKLLNHINENLQFEVELIRVRKKTPSPTA